MRKRKVIGITGAFGSGKSTAANFFVSLGCVKIVLSSFLEQEAKKRSNSLATRKVLQDIANEWRELYGASFLAKKAIEQGKAIKGDLIIDGIRNIGEIEALRQTGNFILLSIVTNRRVRFDRLKLSPRRESLTWELFAKLDYRDLGVGEKDSGLQTGLCIGLADVYIENNSSLQEFEQKLRLFFEQNV